MVCGGHYGTSHDPRSVLLVPGTESRESEYRQGRSGGKSRVERKERMDPDGDDVVRREDVGVGEGTKKVGVP